MILPCAPLAIMVLLLPEKNERVMAKRLLVLLALESFLVMAGKKPSRDLTRDLIQADAFAAEEIIGLPLEMMRISHRDGIMDAREKCIEKWSFFGPSLPAAFCRCRLRLTVYDDSMPTAAKQAESDDSDEDFVADEIHKGRYIT